MKAVPGMELQQLVLLSATLYKVAESDNVRRGKSGSGFTMTDRSQAFHFPDPDRVKILLRSIIFRTKLQTLASCVTVSPNPTTVFLL